MRLDTQVFAINVVNNNGELIKLIFFAFTSAMQQVCATQFLLSIAQCRLGASPEQIFHTRAIRSKIYHQIKNASFYPSVGYLVAVVVIIIESVTNNTNV